MRSFILLFFYSTFLYGQQNSILWEIKGNGLPKHSYLYGSYHSKDFRAHQFGDSVFSKLAQSDAILVENSETENKIGKKSLQSILMKDTTLESLLNKADYSFLQQKMFEKMGLMAALSSTMKPIFTINMALLLNSRQEMMYTVDDFIKNEGQKQNKPIYELETTTEAVQAIDAISLKEQSVMLLDFFKNYDNNMLIRDSIITIYQSQDLNRLNSFYMNQNGGSFSFDKNLIVDRNNKFINKLIPLIGKESIFCVVGSMHLTGETGLINQLRKKGYEVTPIVSNYTPTLLNIEDKQNWNGYTDDSLYIGMSFPGDPFYETNVFHLTNKDSTHIEKFYLDDTIQHLKYNIIAGRLPTPILKLDKILIYGMIMKQFEIENGWKKTMETNIEYENFPAKELWFYISKETNAICKIILKDNDFYVAWIEGYRPKLNSNISERFFESISFLTCSLEVELEISDKNTHELINDFKIQVNSKTMDTTLFPISKGSISFTLPQEEDNYTIIISSNNYVTKKIEINTTGINKTNKKSLFLKGDVEMIQPKKGVDYSIFDSPVSKARLINGFEFIWDLKYIQEFKKEYIKQFPLKTPQ